MNKKLIAFSSILGLTLSLPLSPANAAVKAGTSCKTVGITLITSGKTFTCIKSGRKLVWNNGVALPKFVPWSNPINQSQELLAFRNNVDTWFKAQTLKNVDINVYVDPKISASEIPWITSALNFQAKLTGLSAPANYKIYIGKTDKWVINKRKSVMPGLENWAPDYVCYKDTNEGCAYPSSQEVLFIWTTSPLLSPSEDWQFTRSVSHEFFHITQCDLVGNPQRCGDYFNSVPSWLAEGGPNVIGAIFADRLGNLKYEDQRKIAISYYQNGKAGGNTPLSAFSQNPFSQGPSSSGLNPYEIGMLASEYLIASAGFQAFFDFYSNLPVTNSFEEAFQKSFGIKLDDFYTAFDKARVNLGFHPVSKN
jgi:hypothetical protein